MKRHTLKKLVKRLQKDYYHRGLSTKQLSEIHNMQTPRINYHLGKIKMTQLEYLLKYYTDEDLRYPIYRGCDKEPTNAELETCSKRKITNFIKMSFDIEMASRALPLARSTQFLLEFTISKNGKIKNINAKANHKAIAIEAINVAKRLPKFKAPGTLNGKPVDTPFKLLMTLYF